MSIRIQAAAATLAFVVSLAACSGERDRIRALPLPASSAFDPAEVVDVLAPDVIRALDRPAFQTSAEAGEWLDLEAPVVVLDIDGDARAYPLLVLTWHEIVNDTVGGLPVAVTYDPLCNSAITFDRSVAGRVESFAVSGKLYRSDLVMFDRRTHSLWPQLSGRAVRGPLDGTELGRLPSQVASFGEFRAAYPEGRILSRQTGAVRAYGFNPYEGYDARTEPFSFFAPRPDRRLPAMERVVGVGRGDQARAYPYARLAAVGGVRHERLGDEEIVVLWRAGTRSALDTALLANGRDVGSAAVFRPSMDGRRLDLSAAAGGITDRQTGSTWTLLGVAIAGPLKGRRLQPVEHVDAFWFAWAAFMPATTVFEG